MVLPLSLDSTPSYSQDLPFGGTKASGYGRFGEFCDDLFLLTLLIV